MTYVMRASHWQSTVLENNKRHDYHNDNLVVVAEKSHLTISKVHE